jgi:hypothetical protein
MIQKKGNSLPGVENAPGIRHQPAKEEHEDQEGSLTGITKLLLDYMRRRRATYEMPPAITTHDMEEAERMLTNPTEKELEIGRQAVERARRRREEGK